MAPIKFLSEYQIPKGMSWYDFMLLDEIAVEKKPVQKTNKRKKKTYDLVFD